MKTFKLTIITPERIIYQCDDARELNIPTMAGRIGILSDHAPLLSLLKPGELRVLRHGESDYVVRMAVSQGVIDVKHTGDVVVLADTAEHAEDIDTARAEEARARAQALLDTKEHLSSEDYARASAQLEKEIVRIHVANGSGRK